MSSEFNSTVRLSCMTWANVRERPVILTAFMELSLEAVIAIRVCTAALQALDLPAMR